MNCCLLACRCCLLLHACGPDFGLSNGPKLELPSNCTVTSYRLSCRCRRRFVASPLCMVACTSFVSPSTGWLSMRMEPVRLIRQCSVVPWSLQWHPLVGHLLSMGSFVSLICARRGTDGRPFLGGPVVQGQPRGVPTSVCAKLGSCPRLCLHRACCLHCAPFSKSRCVISGLVPD